MHSPDVDITLAMSELDQLLTQTKNSYTLYTCGGAALIYLGYDDRRTGDIDIIEEELSDELKQAAAEVALKLGIGEDWLNNKVHPLGKRLGKNWKSKCTTVFKGKSILLKSISRQDLISSKFHATVERTGKDYDDILWLKPTLAELNVAKEYALKLGVTENYPIFVNGYFDSIKKDLGYE